MTLTLISEAFPVEKRGAAIGLWGALGGMAVAFGPVIGGAIVSGISWHWIFWINVPVGILLVTQAPRRLSESFGPRPQIDGPGVALAAAGALGITWALVRANNVGWGSGVVSPFAGTLADRFGNRWFMTVGLAFQAVGFGWIAAAASTEMSYLQLGMALGLAGIGIGLVFPTVANAVLASVPLEEAGVASGTNSMMRELGGVLGVAILAAVFARHGVYQSPHEFIDGFKSALWVAVGLTAFGVIAAAMSPRRKRRAAPTETERRIALAREHA
jgi:MFS family permease